MLKLKERNYTMEELQEFANEYLAGKEVNETNYIGILFGMMNLGSDPEYMEIDYSGMTEEEIEYLYEDITKQMALYVGDIWEKCYGMDKVVTSSEVHLTKNTWINFEMGKLYHHEQQLEILEDMDYIVSIVLNSLLEDENFEIDMCHVEAMKYILYCNE